MSNNGEARRLYRSIDYCYTDLLTIVWQVRVEISHSTLKKVEPDQLTAANIPRLYKSIDYTELIKLKDSHSAF